MSDVIAKKLNNGFLMCPYSFFQGSKRTSSAVMVLSYLAAFASKAGEGLRIGYETLSEKLGLSRSTVGRKVRELEADGKIRSKRKGGQKSVYTYTGGEYNKVHIHIPLWLYVEKFVVDGEMRSLTNAEIYIAALIYSHSKDPKSKCFTGSVREIAGILNLSEKTVMRAIAVLLRVNLIERTEVGLNRYKKSVLKANMDRFKRFNREEKKKEQERRRAQAQLPQSVIDANAKAARERFYAQRQERMERLADRFTAQANRHPHFDANDRELRMLNLKLAKAELLAPLTLPTLQARKKALEAERARILDEQGVEEWQLEAKNHAVCKICYDSGFKSDGRMCSCYRCES